MGSWKIGLFLVVVVIVVPELCHSKSTGIPMVENSVRFAVDRCKQFLRLSRLLKEEAFADNPDIETTREACLQVVKVQHILDRQTNRNKHKDKKFDDHSQANVRKDVKNIDIDTDDDDDFSPEAKAMIRPKPAKEAKAAKNKASKQKTTDAVHETPLSETPCRVRFHRVPEYDDEDPEIIDKSKPRLRHARGIKSLQVSGPCLWLFYNKPNFRGESFPIDGTWPLEQRELSPTSAWKWPAGHLRSAKLVSRSKPSNKV